LGVIVAVVDGITVRVVARQAVDLLSKVAAERRIEFGLDLELAILRRVIEDPAFTDLANLKLSEWRNL